MEKCQVLQGQEGLYKDIITNQHFKFVKFLKRAQTRPWLNLQISDNITQFLYNSICCKIVAIKTARSN